MNHPKLFVLLLFALIQNNLFAQKIPEGYVQAKIIQAKDLMIGSPTNILFNEELTHMIISYDSKPTYLRVFETQTWKKVNEIEIPGILYLGQSIMDCDDDEILYGDYGNNKPKFYAINILSDYREKAKKNKMPTETCGHVFQGNTKRREQTFRVKDKFIVVLNHPNRTIQILVKKVTRT
jgi:hypothetical protein